MTLLNLFIIYLACGSPFGVYQMTRDEGPRSAPEWASAGAAFLLWPVFLIKLVIERLSPRVISRKDQIEQIRSDIESLAFAEGTTASLFEFREVFYRYTGLVESADSHEGMHPAGELVSVSGRELNDASSKCLSRRNREKVEFHKTLARNEFVDLTSDMVRLGPRHSEILRLALSLTALIDDKAAEDDLSALWKIIPPVDLTDNNDQGKEVWQAQPHSASNIS